MSSVSEHPECQREPLSRPFDVHRWSDYPELNNCLDVLVSELEGLEGRERGRREKDRARFRDAVRCLVLDMYVAWKTDPELAVGVPLGNVHYTRKGRYQALFLKYSSFTAAFGLLVQAGYLTKLKDGFNDPRSGIGRNTRVCATEKLIQLLTGPARLSVPRVSRRHWDEEVIVLRGERPRRGATAPRLEYDDTAETQAMRERLKAINSHLQKQWIDIRITDAEFTNLQLRMRRDYVDEDRDRPFIDFTQTSLVRIFNNGDWGQGGRFYKGWWLSVPSEYRKYITINDKRTCEIDFSALHPVLLYSHIREELQGDAYDIGLPKVPRSLVKETFNKMLNAPGLIRTPKGYAADEIGLDWKKLQAAIADRHAPIKQFFNSGYGLKLQRTDADLAEAVMLRFFSAGHTCLPVHDSFLVHHALADELRAIMVQEFKKLTDQPISTKSIDGYDPELEAAHTRQDTDPSYSPDGFVATSIEDCLSASGEYSGYEQRRLDWLSALKSVGTA